MVTGCAALFLGEICAGFATPGRCYGVFPAVTKLSPMKNDPTFKVLAFAILAGVIVAFASPSRPANTTAYDHVMAEAEASAPSLAE